MEDMQMKKLVGAIAAWALVGAGLGLPGVAVASDRDDILEMATMVRDLGYAGEAFQLEQLTAGMSDSELQLLGDLGFAGINAKMKEFMEYQRAMDAAVPMTAQPQPATILGSAGPQALLEDYDLDHFPQPDYPDGSPCVTPVGETTSAAIKVGFKATLFALREALTAADGLQRAAIHGCNVIVIAIGAGGNVASACIISGVAIGVIDAILSSAEVVADTVIFCDEQIHFAESAASEDRTEFLSHQVEMHDLEMGEALAAHDNAVQAKLQDAIARAGRVEAKLDLELKTQLEVVMDRRTARRPSIFYEERLEELCGLAQEAINDLPAVYTLAANAQQFVDNGRAFMVTHPKRAADECIRGYNLATTGSFELP
jgi:hypothetical protein